MHELFHIGFAKILDSSFDTSEGEDQSGYTTALAYTEEIFQGELYPSCNVNLPIMEEGQNSAAWDKRLSANAELPYYIGLSLHSIANGCTQEGLTGEAGVVMGEDPRLHACFVCQVTRKSVSHKISDCFPSQWHRDELSISSNHNCLCPGNITYHQVIE